MIHLREVQKEVVEARKGIAVVQKEKEKIEKYIQSSAGREAA